MLLLRLPSICTSPLLNSSSQGKTRLHGALPGLKFRVLSAIRKTAPGVEDESLKAGEEKMEDDSGEEKKAEVAPKKELTGEEAELQSKVRKPLSVGSRCLAVVGYNNLAIWHG